MPSKKAGPKAGKRAGALADQGRQATRAECDLWALALDQFARHKVKLVWVKGHASNPGNNRCDEIAVAASKSGDLFVDQGYENKTSASSATKGLFA